MIYAVLLSGGIGSRMGLNIPKQFIKINKKPLLVYCIENFIRISEFDKIIVTAPKEFLKYTKNVVNNFFDDKRIKVIVGGKTRQDTLLKSLEYIKQISKNKNPIVINHDAARIFVSEDQIKQSIEYTKKFSAASPYIPSTDVIIEVNEKNVKKIPNRFNMIHIQTPQGFKLNEYISYFNNLTIKEKRDIHEIIKVYFLNKKSVYLFEGDRKNFKITYPIDIKIAKTIINGE